MTAAPILAAERATVTMGDVTLLEPTSFAVLPGEIWCLTGGNGSGKTTLLRAFLGSRSLTAGSCSVRGEPADMAKPQHRRLVASLVDAIPFARDMTLREQVTLVAAPWYGNSATTAEAAEEVIERLGLSPLGERFPHQVSSGQLQLFGIAHAAVPQRPPAILLRGRVAATTRPSPIPPWVKSPSRQAQGSRRTPHGGSSGTGRTPAGSGPCSRRPRSTRGRGPGPPGRRRRRRSCGRRGRRGA